MSHIEGTIGHRDRMEVLGGRLHIKGEDTWFDIGQDPVTIGRDPACQIVLKDGKVSAVHAELVATEQGVKVRDLGSRNGCYVADVRMSEGYMMKPCSLRMGETQLLFEPKRPAHVEVPPIPSFGPLVGHSEEMRQIFNRLSKVASTDLTLLIGGETGTGKELAAQAVHQASGRSDKPFVVLDCGSIPPSLAEATLFGHERGAFTGAVNRQASLFHNAQGGTVFLDELGELPIDLQPKLLRALAERRVKPVGGSTYTSFDVRIIAATRRDLVRAVNSGAFRSDLYFRVAQVRVELPPLRTRVEDLPLLLRSMLKDMGDESAYKRISSRQLERLMRYDWPGNVRELRNAVAVGYALSEDDEELDIASHLGALTEGFGRPSADGSAMPAFLSPSGEQRPFKEVKRELLAQFAKKYFSALAQAAKGNVSEMARRAQMERAHIRGYIKEHSIEVKKYRHRG